MQSNLNWCRLFNLITRVKLLGCFIPLSMLLCYDSFAGISFNVLSYKLQVDLLFFCVHTVFTFMVHHVSAMLELKDTIKS
jgi:hypothetical protein